jgi:hypothetical protein
MNFTRKKSQKKQMCILGDNFSKLCIALTVMYINPPKGLVALTVVPRVLNLKISCTNCSIKPARLKNISKKEGIEILTKNKSKHLSKSGQLVIKYRSFILVLSTNVKTHKNVILLFSDIYIMCP